MARRRIHVHVNELELDSIDNALLPGESRSAFIVSSALELVDRRKTEVKKLRKIVNKVRESEAVDD
mgnify:CR=1 FL=1